ncbi:hypothetical protein JZ751_011537 [Albula glossodonta]|uniref:Uncharacterized protein n=1 Tax=Albula glossodonta TaxID=121402 RepID=A0A8T2N6M0_9TELE|nr:hypothetical protein JZ751_011537 [Albula glossodonta]
MWKLGITNSYTMESTFGGSTLGNRKGTHFTVQDLKSLGYCLCDTLLDYCDPDQTKARQCLVELGAIRRKEIQHKLGRDVDSDASLSDVSESDLESSTSGSNSTESNDLPVHLLNIIDKTPALLSEEAVQTGTRDAVAVSDSRKERKVRDAEGSVCRRQRPGLFSSLRHRQPLMRQPVAVTAMQQPGSCPWPSPCGLDQGPLSGTGELLPPRHSRLSVRPAHRLKPCREAKAELLPVSATHHTMDASFTSSETQETLRKNQEKDGAGAVSVKEPSEPQRGTITDVHSSLPDTKKQELGTELPSRRLSLTAFPKAVEMGHGIPRIPSARPVLLEPLCPQRAQLQQLQSLSLAKATKSPPSSTENGPSDPNRT